VGAFLTEPTVSKHGNNDCIEKQYLAMTMIDAHTVKCDKCLTLHTAVQQFNNDWSGIVILKVNKQ